MKRTTLFAATAVAALAIAGAASAEDFAGPYVGAQIGYAWSDADMPYGNVGAPSSSIRPTPTSTASYLAAAPA